MDTKLRKYVRHPDWPDANRPGWDGWVPLNEYERIGKQELTAEQAMAFLYVNFRRILSSMPTCIDDFFEQLPPECEEEGVYALIMKADLLAKKLGYTVY